MTGRVFEASGTMLAIAEGWSRGPRVDPIDDPTRLGPLVEELLAGTRGNAGMDGTPGSSPQSQPDSDRPYVQRRRHSMPLNPEAVGTRSEPQDASWTSKDALLYAVSLGAGTHELAFTTENTSDVAQQVLPTFPVVIPNRSGSLFAAIGSFNPAMLVHGTQSVTLNRPLPTDGTAYVGERGRRDVRQGEGGRRGDRHLGDARRRAPVHHSLVAVHPRRGWLGRRARPVGPTERAPRTRRRSRRDVSDLARPGARVPTNGDRNPLHSDPSFAAMGGFDRPILHGLCTYGFTGRALLHTLCGSDPARFEHVEGRFASPVLPGDELTISMWATSDAEAVFTTSVGDRVVIDQGLLRHT